MDNALGYRRRLVVFALAVVLALVVVVVLPRASSAEPPVPVDGSVEREGFCDFRVLHEETGHVKLRELPGGDFLLTGQLETTLTNLRNQENQLVDRGGGFSGRVTPLTEEGLEGDVLVVARGHNILFDPGEGIFLIIGKVTFTVAGGPFVGGDITILESRGKVIDVCAALA
jgi:hypothetical protein